MLYDIIKKYDGYYEQLAFLTEGLNPYFRIRAVKNSKSNFDIVIRECSTGKAILFKNINNSSFLFTLEEGKKLLIKFLVDCTKITE